MIITETTRQREQHLAPPAWVLNNIYLELYFDIFYYRRVFEPFMK